MTDSDSTKSARWSPQPWLVVGVVVVLPLLIAAVVLSRRSWYPVLDMAMTEFRVRDVGTNQTPLIGLPGRIGAFPDQGNHPGPWSFYLIAPMYRLVGATAYGMQLGSLVINGCAALATLWVVQRRGQLAVTIGAGAVIAFAIRGYGLQVLSHPWNPYFPLILWLLVMFSTWAVLEGDRWMVLGVVGAGTVAAQTHVPYLLPCVALSLVALGALSVRSVRAANPTPDRWALGGGFGLAAFMWLPPIVDQLVREPGNIRRLIEHFTGATDEDSVGLKEGTTIFFRHLDAPGAVVRMFNGPQAFLDMSGVESGIRIGAVITLAAWIAAVAVAIRMRHLALLHLHIVVGICLVVGWFSMTRIFGKIWFYLTLWAWGTTLVAVLAVVWTAVAWWQGRASEAADPRPRRAALVLASLSIFLMSTMSVLANGSLEVPEPQISDALGAAVGPTVDAIESGVGAAVGKQGTYVVFWQDAAFIGAPGYGLVNELERRGFDVGVHPTWRVPVTAHRVVYPGEYDAEIHLVTGDFIDEWRERSGYVEVAAVDVRTDAERAEFARLEQSVIDRLLEIGRNDLVPVVTENLFGALIEPGLPDDVVHAMERMLIIFKPVSVFIVPPGSSS